MENYQYVNNYNYKDYKNKKKLNNSISSTVVHNCCNCVTFKNSF